MSLEVVLAVGLALGGGDDLLALLSAEVKEMSGPVCLIVEVLGVVEDERVPHVAGEVDAVEVVVPDASLGDHVEAQEFVTQDHLHPLIQRGAVARGVRASNPVLPGPIDARLRHPVERERAGAGGEGHRQADRRVRVPSGRCVQQELALEVRIKG